MWPAHPFPSTGTVRFGGGRLSGFVTTRLSEHHREKDTRCGKASPRSSDTAPDHRRSRCDIRSTGVRACQPREIVEASSGLTKGALYFHFKSKDDLAQAVMDRQHAISIAAVEAISSTAAPALEQIVMLCHEMGRQIVDDPIVRAGIRLTLEFSAGTAPGKPGPYQDWIEACRHLSEIAIAEGDLLPTIEPPTLARFVISAFTGVQMVSNVLDRRADLEQRIDQMWQFLLPGILAPDRRLDSDKIRQARWARDPAMA